MIESPRAKASRAVPLLLALTLCAPMLLSSSPAPDRPILPPELAWWLAEARRANPDISLDDFKLVGSTEEKLVKEPIDEAHLYPVFMRWNYSASRCAYLPAGASLIREADGRYHVERDADDAFWVLDRDLNIVHMGFTGIASGFDTAAWLRDDLLVIVGGTVQGKGDDEEAMYDLDIRVISFGAGLAREKLYTLADALTNSARLKLKLNWTDQRDDYFVPRRG